MENALSAKKIGRSLKRTAAILISLALLAASAPQNITGAGIFGAMRHAAASLPHRETLRLALLPVENFHWLDDGGQAYVERELRRLVHVPLNSTLKAVEYLDGGQARRDLAELAASGQYYTAKSAQKKRKKIDYPALLAALAAKEGAGLVLYLTIDTAYEQIYMNFVGQTVVEAGVAMTLYGYDARDGQPIKKNAVRTLYEEYAGRGLAEVTEEAFDYILQTTAIRERIFPPRLGSQLPPGAAVY